MSRWNRRTVSVVDLEAVKIGIDIREEWNDIGTFQSGHRDSFIGRGVESADMPLVRSIVHDAAPSNYRFSSLVLSIVKSAPFQMNTKIEPSSSTTSTASARPVSDNRGVN